MCFKLEGKYRCHIRDWTGTWNSWSYLCQWDYIKLLGLFLHYIKPHALRDSGTQLSKQPDRLLWGPLLWWHWDSVGQSTWSTASCYLPEQSSMNYSLLVVFASPVLFTPTSVPSSLCIPTAGLSPDPRFLLLSVLAFFLEYCCRRYGSLCGSVKCLLLKRQRAVFSLSLATPHSAPPGMTLLRSFILFSESQAPAITSHWNQCQALKGSSYVQHLSRNSPIYMGKAPGSSGRLALSCACCKTNKRRFI